MKTMEQVKKSYVRDVWEMTHRNKTHAAEILGVSRETLSRWVWQWDLPKAEGKTRRFYRSESAR